MPCAGGQPASGPLRLTARCRRAWRRPRCRARPGGQGRRRAAGLRRPADVAQMIRLPALMAGLTFERRGEPEEGLDDVLRDAASGNPTVLPLLEFTLDELWRRSAGSGVLKFSDYENLGGLQGAIKIRAEETFARQPEAVQAALPKVLAA